MKWYLHDLLSGHDNDSTAFTEELPVEDELLDRYSDRVYHAGKFNVTGHVNIDRGDVILSFHATGMLIVPSSRSLEPVNLPMDFEVAEYYVLSKAAEERYSKEEVVFVVDEDYQINTNLAVIDNIILNIPMRVLSPNEINSKQMPSGNDWQVISIDEEKKAKLNTVDPRLAKLKDFFDK